MHGMWRMFNLFGRFIFFRMSGRYFMRTLSLSEYSIICHYEERGGHYRWYNF